MAPRDARPERHRPLGVLALVLAVALLVAILWAHWLEAPLAALLVVYLGLIVWDRTRPPG